MSKESVQKARELYRKQALLERIGIDPGIVPQIQKQAERLRTWFELRCGGDGGYVEFNEAKGTWVHFLPDNMVVQCVYSRAVPSVEDQVKDWLSKNLPEGVRVEFQPDPRGHSLYVYYGTGETEYVSFG